MNTWEGISAWWNAKVLQSFLLFSCSKDYEKYSLTRYIIIPPVFKDHTLQIHRDIRFACYLTFKQRPHVVKDCLILLLIVICT